ncbi:4Fe-4S dicluster domain-containing protein [Leptospira sp. GIMC2001]|uniref:4Fe-4S dicluster domain-containing protein n=1 Tax=Leptospira sp. GIMC2001 TaxID=1513297 RepID=UPI00234B2E5A|nr:4Fe-4S dicluster domain-containing protein [Leptospira sp. GIMC2001]WCL48748.1 hypothetical protein O4O04_15780 [Leptospira sp. GIMC2001]
MRLGDPIAFVGNRKILSSSNGIAEFNAGERNYFKITQDGGLENKNEFIDENFNSNGFFNRLEKNGIYSLDFPDTPLWDYLSQFASTANAELILSPYSRNRSPDFQKLIQNDYSNELKLVENLFTKLFPERKIHSYFHLDPKKYSYPMGIPNYFIEYIAGFKVLSNLNDSNRIFYLGSETIWHLIRALYFDLAFTKRHLAVFCIDSNGSLDARERNFLLSNGQSFQFTEKLFKKKYKSFSIGNFFQPTEILTNVKDHYFDIYEENSLTFYQSKPRDFLELPCTECFDCNTFCPTGANPLGLILNNREFQKNLCVECGICTALCPSGIDIQKKILVSKLGNANE